MIYLLIALRYIFTAIITFVVFGFYSDIHADNDGSKLYYEAIKTKAYVLAIALPTLLLLMGAFK